jgi:hypothetical protein
VRLWDAMSASGTTGISNYLLISFLELFSRSASLLIKQMIHEVRRGFYAWQ